MFGVLLSVARKIQELLPLPSPQSTLPSTNLAVVAQGIART